MAPDIAMTGTLYADDEFNVQWQDPEEEKLTWIWDPAHDPFPNTPLSVDRGRMSAAVHREVTGVAEDKDRPQRIINGFPYRVRPPDGGGPEARWAALSEERRRQIAEESKDPWGTWKRKWEPEIRGLLEPIKSDDMSSVSYQEMVDRLGDIFRDSGRATAITMSAAQVMFAVSDPFVEFCKTEFGGQGELMAATMLGGYANYSTASDRALWDIARTLRDRPNPTHTLYALQHDPSPTTPDVGGMASRYLYRWGWRASMWGDISTPAWRLDPTGFFDTLRRYVDDMPEDPRVAIRRAADRRRREVAKVRDGLKGDKLKQFNSLLKAASVYVPLREARAFWQVVSWGVLRVPCGGAGARLVEAGVIDAVDDVYYLGLDDIREATAGDRNGQWSKLVADRRAAYSRYWTIVPPITVGAPFEGDLQELVDRAGRFRGTESSEGADTADSGLVFGTSASRGTVRATARVIRSLDEADRLSEGEVLVCRSTSPPWTPLIARSAGVVAETGGVLMHCAIVTREYAIPCVVGVGPVDGRIVDGSTITVDGSQGIVRLE